MKLCSSPRVCLIAVALLVPLAPLRAQVVRYATDFPDATGWTLDPPASAGSPCCAGDARGRRVDGPARGARTRRRVARPAPAARDGRRRADGRRPERGE